MASDEVMAIVDGILAGWTHMPKVTPNGKSNPPGDDAAYLNVTYPVAGEQPISTGTPGSNTFRESGGILLTMNVPAGVGTAGYTPWGTELRNLFRGVVQGTFQTFGASPPAIDDRNDGSGYYKLSIAVEYQYDIFA